MLKYFFSALLLLAASLPAVAQTPFSIAASPRSTQLSFATATFTISVTPRNGFSASVLLSATVPSLPKADVSITPSSINTSSPTTATLRVMVKGEKISGVHDVIIVGRNGPAEARDTVTIVIPAQTTWRVFNTDNSMIPDNNVTKIEFDRNGIAWIGTAKGLASFDGTNWTRFAPTPDAIRDISIDSSGGVWVVTETAVESYRQGVWTQHDITAVTAGYIHADIATAPNGDVWVASGSKLHRYRQGAWQAFDVGGPTLNHIATDTRGNIWATYGAGVMKFDGTYQTLYSHDVDSSFPAIFNANGVSIDRRNHVWVAGNRGLAELSGTTWIAYKSPDDIRDARTFPGPSPYVVDFDARGIAWVANAEGDFGGVTRYDGTNRWFYTIGNSAIPSNNVATLRVKKDTSIWIGTYDGGLAILNGTTPPERIYYLGVDDGKTSITTDGALRRVFPNPANAGATIRLALKKSARVRLSVIDMLGREQSVAFDGAMEAGERDIAIDLTGISTGSYFVRLSTDGTISTTPLTIVR